MVHGKFYREFDTPAKRIRFAKRDDGQLFIHGMDVANALRLDNPSEELTQLLRFENHEVLFDGAEPYHGISLTVSLAVRAEEYMSKKFIKWLIYILTIELAKVKAERDEVSRELNEVKSGMVDKKLTFTIDEPSRGEVFAITQVAKKFGMSSHGLNAILHKLGVQYKVGKQWVLYSEHQNKGYVATLKAAREDGSIVNYHTYWTGKGVKFVEDLLFSNGFVAQPRFNLEEVSDHGEAN